MQELPRRVRMGARTIHVADDQPTFWDRVEAGRWEPGTLALIDQLVDGGTTFLDLGAWVGPTALYAATRARRVIAVEADPAALDQLKRNLSVNPDLAQRIDIVAGAIDAREGPVTLGARRKAGDSMSSTLLANSEHTWTAAAITPAQLAGRLRPDERLVLKIDIEGAEYALLPHLAPLLDRADAILAAFHPTILAAALGNRREAARQTRAALSALARFTAHRVTRDGAGGRSLAPELVRWGLRGRLPGDEWLFVRRRASAPPR
ncbi:MAG TPA: FkbM family methyltransferase [Beijerinckiaceae bacterium]|jgi:FkbM family methyltransferase